MGDNLLTENHDVQNFLNGYMERLVAETIEELSVTGLDSLATDGSYLYISNHRDIFMDTGLLNYVIFHAGHQTARSAVGDNLLTEKYAADLMRLNKSFVIERSDQVHRKWKPAQWVPDAPALQKNSPVCDAQAQPF